MIVISNYVDKEISNSYANNRKYLVNINRTLKDLTKPNLVNSEVEYDIWKEDVDKAIKRINHYVDLIGKSKNSSPSSKGSRFTKPVEITPSERDRLALLSMYRFNAKYFDDLSKILMGYKHTPTYSDKELHEWYQESVEAISELIALRDRTTSYLQRYNKYN